MFNPFLFYVHTIINLDQKRIPISELSLSNIGLLSFLYFSVSGCNTEEISLGYFGCLPHRTIYVKSQKTPWTTICSLQQLLLISFHLLQISYYSTGFVPKITSVRLCLPLTCFKSSSSSLIGIETLVLGYMQCYHYQNIQLLFKTMFRFVYNKYFIYFKICVRKTGEEEE